MYVHVVEIIMAGFNLVVKRLTTLIPNFKLYNIKRQCCGPG